MRTSVDYQNGAITLKVINPSEETQSKHVTIPKSIVNFFEYSCVEQFDKNCPKPVNIESTLRTLQSSLKEVESRKLNVKKDHSIKMVTLAIAISCVAVMILGGALGVLALCLAAPPLVGVFLLGGVLLAGLLLILSSRKGLSIADKTPISQLEAKIKEKEDLLEKQWNSQELYIREKYGILRRQITAAIADLCNMDKHVSSLSTPGLKEDLKRLVKCLPDYERTLQNLDEFYEFLKANSPTSNVSLPENTIDYCNPFVEMT